MGLVPEWAGHTLAALALPARLGVTVLAIASGGEQMVAPDPHRPLVETDRLVLTGTPDNLERVRAMAGVKEVVSDVRR